MNMKKHARSVLTALAAGGVAALLAISGAASANAVPGLGDSPIIQPLPGNEGLPLTGTVTVHKHEQGQTVGAAANGLPQTIDTPTITGVTFTATQITNVDLTTNEGWQAAARINYDAATGTWSKSDDAGWAPTFGAEITRTTGTDTYENAVFADIPVGLYLFAETDAPANVTKSAPWVMTVPLTHPTERDSWLYDIHVYPKNAVTGAVKTVEDATATKVGDVVTWTIKGDIPRVANPEFDNGAAVSPSNLEFFAPTAYVVKDQLDSRLALASSNPVVVTITENGPALTPGTDYTVVPDPTTGTGEQVVVTFTEAGRVKLGQAASIAGAQVQVVIRTNVVSLTTPEEDAGTIGDGIIKNTAHVFPNQESVDSDTPVSTPEVESRWGDILIHKVDASDTAVSLADAKFSVYASEGDALAGSDAITINGESVFTTTADGVVRISGLRYSDFADGATVGVGDPGYRTYWLVEVEAPTGYELLAKPIEVIVNQAQQTVAAATEIENAPHNGGFELPLTGGAGTWMFLVGGLLVIGGGIVMSRRKKKVQPTI